MHMETILHVDKPSLDRQWSRSRDVLCETPMLDRLVAISVITKNLDVILCVLCISTYTPS